MVAKGYIADPFLDGALASKSGESGKEVPTGENQKKTPGMSTKQKREQLSRPQRDRHTAEQAQKELKRGTGKKSIPDVSDKRPPKPKKEKKQRKFPYRKVSDLEEEIFIRETRVMTLNEDLLKPEILRDGDLTRRLTAELAEEQEILKKLYEHWEEATELN